VRFIVAQPETFWGILTISQKKQEKMMDLLVIFILLMLLIITFIPAPDRKELSKPATTFSENQIK